MISNQVHKALIVLSKVKSFDHWGNHIALAIQQSLALTLYFLVMNNVCMHIYLCKFY